MQNKENMKMQPERTWKCIIKEHENATKKNMKMHHKKEHENATKKNMKMQHKKEHEMQRKRT